MTVAALKAHAAISAAIENIGRAERITLAMANAGSIEIWNETYELLEAANQLKAKLQTLNQPSL